jgi:tRNA threonylcarbamoyladenosine biosynthesis protein TsaB
MRVLALSTSTPQGSVALVEDGPGGPRVLGAAGYEDLRGHAERLFAAIDAALAAAGLGREAIGALACDVGPGSFTGVRVGVSAAKGIALALGLGVVGVGSLEVMAAVSGAPRVVPMLDAKKDEVFAALYDASGPIPVPIDPPRHLARGDVAAWLAGLGKVVLAGAVTSEIEALDRWTRLRGQDLDGPTAARVGTVALAHLAATAMVAPDPAQVEPLYVRAPDAQLAREPPPAAPRLPRS